MIELPSEKFSQITFFFDKNTTNFPVVMAVIEANNPGRIWVDQLINPSICLVITNGGYSFIGKKAEIKESLVLELIEILINNKPIKLISALNNPLLSLFEKSGFTCIERIQFYHPAIIKHDFTRINAICKRLPSDCEIKLIDETLLKKSNWLSFIKQIYGSEENFLENGYGLALIQDSELISEAFACYIGGNYVEAGYVTSEKYRGEGYAAIVTAFLIKESLSRNLQPATSCNADNRGSAKTSQKLGFEEEKRYCFLTI